MIRTETVQRLARNKTKPSSKSFIKEEDEQDLKSPTKEISPDDLFGPTNPSLSVNIPTSPPPRSSTRRAHSSSVPVISSPALPLSALNSTSDGSDTPVIRVPPSRRPATRPGSTSSGNSSIVGNSNNLFPPETTSSPRTARSVRSTSLNARPAPPQRQAPPKPPGSGRTASLIPSTATVS